jgi:photosynthetic reaction center H subunit
MAGTRLMPMPLARSSLTGSRSARFGKRFAHVPKTASPRQVTKLEEDKISGFTPVANSMTADEMLARFMR